MDIYFYLILVEDDVDPDVQGPFVSADERNTAGTEYRKEGFDGGIFPLNITAEEEPYKVETETLENIGFEEAES